MHTIHDEQRTQGLIGQYTSAQMLSATSSLHGQQVRSAAMEADPLCEFESERGSMLRLEARPSIVLSRREKTLAHRSRRSSRPKRRGPVLVIRFERPSVPWRQIALGVTTIVLLAVPSALFSPAAGARRPSPAATARPGPPPNAKSLVAVATALTPPFVAALSAAGQPPSAPQPEHPSNKRPRRRLAGGSPAPAFEVSGSAQHVVVAPAPDVVHTPVEEAIAADAPPRRIGPVSLSLAALGGAKPNGSVSLLLDVTEAGDVARVVVERAIDLAPSFVEALSAAARAWRYEPARRDGVTVPAQVRATVELHGDN